MKRRRTYPNEHCEGDIEAEELYYDSNKNSDGDITAMLFLNLSLSLSRGYSEERAS
jgi:hypothetical protein